MSKIIKITPDCLEEIRRDFETALKGAKIADGKINFTKTFGYVNKKATIYFTEITWLKMQSLIREFDKEVAWHGVASRGTDESKDDYYITDILIYPQEVTGATVNTDQEKYETWLMRHEDDVFNNIRMQGHSHVNMGTTPSTVDITHQEKILEQLEDDMFYIFMIWNKRGEKNIKIYDLAKNLLFDNTDVSVEIQPDGIGIEQFIKDAKSMVKDKVYTPTTISPYNKNYGYGGYYGKASSTTNYYSSQSNSGKKKKGKRKRDKNNTYLNDTSGNPKQTTVLNMEDEYDDNNLFKYRNDGYY